jgi:hypothetical protein
MVIIRFVLPVIENFMRNRWKFHAQPLEVSCSTVGNFMRNRWKFYAHTLEVLCACVGSFMRMHFGRTH